MTNDSAVPSFALTVQILDGVACQRTASWTGWIRRLVYLREMHSFYNMGTLALSLSNADGEAEEGAKGDTVAAFPALPRTSS